MNQGLDSLNNKNLLSLLSYQRGNMSQALQRLIDYILDNKDKIIFLNLSQLAINADVGEATVIRLAKHLGYRGFQDFKIDLAIAISERVDTSIVDAKIEPGDNSLTTAKKVLNQITLGIEDNIKYFDEESIERAASAIYKARKVLVFGMGNSGICADFLQNKLSRINIQAISIASTHFMYTQAALLNRNDVAIAISYHGSVYETLKGLKIAKGAGAQCIAITHNLNSELAKEADILLKTGGQETVLQGDNLSTMVAQFHLCEVLYIKTVMKNSDEAFAAKKKTVEALSLRV